MIKRTNHKVAIDLGCGEMKRIGSIGIDIRRTSVTDILADARFLPFRNNSIDVVYSSHLIEHFPHITVRKAIKEWARVMRKGAIIDITCPDLRARSLLFFLSPSWQNIRNIYGEQDYSENYHKSGFSFGLLRRLLESCGIRKVKRILDGYKGIPFLPNCLHVRGYKSTL